MSSTTRADATNAPRMTPAIPPPCSPLLIATAVGMVVVVVVGISDVPVVDATIGADDVVIVMLVLGACQRSVIA